ncbi:MAG: hypothetical protein RIR48_2024, partial [Bacteroidota bacterium]
MKSLLTTFLFISFQFVVFGQKGIMVNGTVKDQKTNEPVIGCSIALKNSTEGTITDVDGAFSLQASADGILVFSYIGYVTQEIPIGGRTQ